MRSFRFCGRRPSGSPADPLGKELITRATSFSVYEDSCGLLFWGWGNACVHVHIIVQDYHSAPDVLAISTFVTS